MNTPPGLLDRLFRVLTVFLAVGNLVWFILTFPGYFQWLNTGLKNPAIQLILLWVFLGLPSLICAVVALRRAAAQGGAGILLKLAFLTILSVCALVVLLASVSQWTVDLSPTRRFPWITWLLTALASLLIALYAFAATASTPEPTGPESLPKPGP